MKGFVEALFAHIEAEFRFGENEEPVRAEVALGLLALDVSLHRYLILKYINA